VLGILQRCIRRAAKRIITTNQQFKETKTTTIITRIRIVCPFHSQLLNSKMPPTLTTIIRSSLRLLQQVISPSNGRSRTATLTTTYSTQISVRLKSNPRVGVTLAVATVEVDSLTFKGSFRRNLTEKEATMDKTSDRDCFIIRKKLIQFKSSRTSLMKALSHRGLFQYQNKSISRTLITAIISQHSSNKATECSISCLSMGM